MKQKVKMDNYKTGYLREGIVGSGHKNQKIVVKRSST